MDQSEEIAQLTPSISVAKFCVLNKWTTTQFGERWHPFMPFSVCPQTNPINSVLPEHDLCVVHLFITMQHYRCWPCCYKFVALALSVRNRSFPVSCLFCYVSEAKIYTCFCQMLWETGSVKVYLKEVYIGITLFFFLQETCSESNDDIFLRKDLFPHGTMQPQ